MLYRLYVKQKASIWTLFAFIASALFTPLLFADSCNVSRFHETASVAYIYDGDTIKLSDGRKIRLIGINTPERGRDGKKDEPFALAATKQLQQIIKASKNQVKIVYGKDKHDRYKRLLAHIFTLKNENITATLLEKGMGFTLAIPPNIQLLGCYKKAEQHAQNLKRGIWHHSYSNIINVAILNKTAHGFHQVSGTVDRIGESRTSLWLNLNSKTGTKFALRILKKELPYFNRYQPKNLLNRQVVARGWIYKIKDEQRMTIHHPFSLRILNPD